MSKYEAKKDKVVFFCKDCEELVDTERVGGKYVYKCKKCSTKNVAFGTEKSIYGFFRIAEREEKKKKEAIRRAREEEKVKSSKGEEKQK